jgi:hypothetical protein
MSATVRTATVRNWDYYNAFVIQPMLVEGLDVVGDEVPGGAHSATWPVAG